MSAQQWETAADEPEAVGVGAGLALLLAAVERRQRVALETAQRDLGVAVKAATRLVPGPNLWLSEDRAERRLGAERCRGCPVITECAAVAPAVPSQAWGVFGGHDYAATGDGLGELRLLGEASELGPDAETRRDELLLELARTGRWSNGELAKAARLSGSAVRQLLNQGGVAQQGREVELAELGRRNGSRLRELRAIEYVPAGPAGAPVRARRDLLLVEVWETGRGSGWPWCTASPLPWSPPS